MQLIDKRALIDVELALLAQAKEQRERVQVDEHEHWWLGFQAAAPAPVWDYVVAIDVEAGDDRFYAPNPDRWIRQRHPLVRDAIEAVHDALEHHRTDRLSLVQGWMLKGAWWHLGWAYAKDRQPQTGGVHYTHVVQDQAAHELLDWTRAEAQQGWLEPERFLERWRFLGNVPRNPDVLEHAALFGAELKLLESEDD